MVKAALLSKMGLGNVYFNKEDITKKMLKPEDINPIETEALEEELNDKVDSLNQASRYYRDAARLSKDIREKALKNLEI